MIVILYERSGEKPEGMDFMEWVQPYLHIRDYLTRRGYFFPLRSHFNGQPTRKFFKALEWAGVRIGQLKEMQDEFEKTNHVKIYDKFGNEKVL